jgi:hypothetical protein
MLGNRGESMQMSELMGPFQGMSTTAGGEMMNSSSDTIGTIDNMTAYGLSSSISQNISGISNMSVISMSSTTSLFKAASNGSSDMAMGFREEGRDGDLWPGAGSEHANTESLTLPPQQAMPIPPLVWKNNAKVSSLPTFPPTCGIRGKWLIYCGNQYTEAARCRPWIILMLGAIRALWL